ncbi:MAG: hypothetical protein ACK2T3_15125 [Candidatus Promineifilaceae bacterium]
MGKIINILFIVLAVILVACGEDAEPTEEIAAAEASAVAETATNIPVPLPPEIKLTANECNYLGPTELTSGDHSFHAKGLAVTKMIWLGQTTGDHTFQELLDLETKPKDVFELPSWIDRLEHLSREKDEAAGVRFSPFA